MHSPSTDNGESGARLRKRAHRWDLRKEACAPASCGAQLWGKLHLSSGSDCNVMLLSLIPPTSKGILGVLVGSMTYSRISCCQHMRVEKMRVRTDDKLRERSSLVLLLVVGGELVLLDGGDSTLEVRATSADLGVGGGRLDGGGLGVHLVDLLERQQTGSRR
ncbi:hypothetical protein L1887_48894 [Cichorium endivia]|nr:hypothetical protein L1887_48894 [Cichorium endivia]